MIIFYFFYRKEQYFKQNTDQIEKKRIQSGPKLAKRSGNRPRSGKTDPVGHTAPPLPPPKISIKKNLVSSKNGPQCARPFYVLYFFEFGNPDSPVDPSLLLGHALYLFHILVEVGKCIAN